MERKIKDLDTTDAETLSELAKTIYVQYYLHLWEPGGADWYMHEFAYNTEVIKSELADKNNLHYFVYEKEQPIGFLKLKINTPFAGNPLEIERIYLLQQFKGIGIGKYLIQFAESVAAGFHKSAIVLKAMDSSLDAIGFYKKMGFEIIGNSTLPFLQMKETCRGMVTMQKKLKNNLV